jgi:hypothetical protein
MKILPKTKEEWLRLLSLPFKAYIFIAGFAYAYWRLHISFHPIVGLGSLTEGLNGIVLGYIISFFAFLILAFIQAFIKRFGDALWSVFFAVLAALCVSLLCLGQI